MINFKRASMLAAAALFCGGAYGQSTGNILINPDMVLDANGGRTSQSLVYPNVSVPVDFGGTAAAEWAFVTIPFANLTIDTELVPSDFMPGGQMLHVWAHGVGFVQLRPIPSDTALEFGHRATFCAWVKVVRGGSVAVQAGDTASGGAPTGEWQDVADHSDHTTPNGPAITVIPQRPPGDTGTSLVLGDVDFYVATADYTPQMLSACPRATLDDVSHRRQPLNVPPRQPRVEHPNWGGPASSGPGDPYRRNNGPSEPDQKSQQFAPTQDK